jgi:hypothetical protein
MTEVIHQSVGFFDDPNAIREGILPLQASPSDPTLPTLATATGMLTPDEATAKRLNHFDPNLFDLRPESHLVRFMRVLLGDTGAGQLRKRYTVARLQTVLNSTHFYDLDGLYGSLFGAQRTAFERLPINPMTGTATPDDWDDISTRDASYRERIYALAKALPLAGTVAGLQQAAEALTGVECDVEETWKILDSGITTSAGYTWDEIEGLGTWDDIEGPSATWDSVAGVVTIGRAGVSNRDEVYVRPKKDYAAMSADSREVERLRLEDEMGLQRVLSAIKPAGVLLTIDPSGLPLHRRGAIAAIVADSNYWEVVRKVRPKPGIAVSEVYGEKQAVLDGNGFQVIPRPPFSGGQGYQWSYNPLITSVSGFATSADGTVVDPSDWEIVINPATDRTEQYVPAKGIADQRTVLAAQASADSILVAHPYSAPRTAVTTRD